MTKLKCPIHNTELAYLDEGVYGHTYCGMTGNIKLWQALIDAKNQLTVERTTHDILQEELKKLQKELADTKKKLDIAVGALNSIVDYGKNCVQ